VCGGCTLSAPVWFPPTQTRSPFEGHGCKRNPVKGCGASFPCSLFHSERVGNLCSRHCKSVGRHPPVIWTEGLERLLLKNRPQFNYEPFNSSSVNIRSWSWNYRGCWHQTCPPIVTRYSVDLNTPHWNLPNTVKVSRRPISFHCLTHFLALGNLRACCPP